MQGKLLYEYAVIRIVPRVERSEFINAGVILFCRDAQFLGMRYLVDEGKILAMHAESDIEKMKHLLNAFKDICMGKKEAGVIARAGMADRFRWLTAQRSTLIQVSDVHPGLTSDPNGKLEQLFKEMVL